MTEKRYLHYHPDPFKKQNWLQYFFKFGGQRNVYKRLDAMLKHYDFKGKKVMDLGCSGAFYSLSIARSAASVLGIDGDKDLVARNQGLAQSNNMSHVEFKQMMIDKDSIASLPNVDIIVFLSVLHHLILGTAELYPYNQEAKGTEYGVEILKALSAKTQTLFFETGQSDETDDWAKKLQPMGAKPEEWIVENLLKPAGFRHVKVVKPPEWEGFMGGIRKFQKQNLVGIMNAQNPIGSLLRRLFGYHQADCRYMFLASTQPFKED